jgi:hypothetical protein
MKIKADEWIQIIALAIGILAIVSALLADCNLILCPNKPLEEPNEIIQDWDIEENKGVDWT